MVTSTLVFEGQGRVVEYAGGYDDWLLQRPKPAATEGAEEKKARTQRPTTSKPQRLTFNQAQELKALPGTIEALEREQAALHARMADPEYYKCGKAEIVADQRRLEEIETAVSVAYARWEQLDAIGK